VERFTDEKVRHIKRALLRGTHPLVIAQAERCSEATIWRIKTGRTYNHVVVAGEAELRPKVELVDYVPVGMEEKQTMKAVVEPMSEAQLEQRQREILERLENGRKADEMFERARARVEAALEENAELAEQKKKLLGF